MEDLGMDLILDESIEQGLDDSSLGTIVDDGSDRTDTKKNEEDSIVTDEDTIRKAFSSEEPHDDDEEKPSNGVYASLANALKEEGVLPHLEKDITSVDELIDAFKGEIEKNEYGGLSEAQKEYLDAIKAGIPDEVIKEKQKASYTIDKLTDELIQDETDESEELRKNLIFDYFKDKGFDDEMSNTLAVQQISNGTDVEFAIKARDNMKTKVQKDYEDRLKEMDNAKKADSDYMNNLTETILDKGKIGDLSISKDVRTKIYESLTAPVGEENGQKYNKIIEAQKSNPIDFQFKLGYLFEVTKGFSDFSILESNKKTKRKAVDSLEKLLKSGGGERTITGGKDLFQEQEDDFSKGGIILDI